MSFMEQAMSKSSSLGSHPHLRPYLALMLVSNLGNWVQSFTEQWAVLLLAGPEAARWAGRLGLASGLALLVCLPFGGVLTDRLDHRKVVASAQGALALSALAMGLLARHGQLTIPRMLGFAVLAGLAGAVSMPTAFRFLRELVPAARLPEAYAWLILQYDLSRMAGPSVAALLLPRFGIAGNFLLNAASFLPGLLWLGWYAARARGRRGPDGPEAGPGYGAVRRAVQADPALKACLLLAACFGLCAWNHLALLPVFATRYLGLGAAGVAFLMGLLGFGALGASFWAARGKIRQPARWLSACFPLYGSLLVLWSLQPGPLVSRGLCLLIGPTQALMWILLNGEVQRLSPPALAGRTGALFLTLGMGLMPVGNLLAGEAAQLLGTQGPRWVLAAGGLACLAVGLRFHAWTAARLREAGPGASPGTR